MSAFLIVCGSALVLAILDIVVFFFINTLLEWLFLGWHTMDLRMDIEESLSDLKQDFEKGILTSEGLQNYQANTLALNELLRKTRLRRFLSDALSWIAIAILAVLELWLGWKFLFPQLDAWSRQGLL